MDVGILVQLGEQLGLLVFAFRGSDDDDDDDDVKMKRIKNVATSIMRRSLRFKGLCAFGLIDFFEFRKNFRGFKLACCRAMVIGRVVQ